ncbi:MAG: 50S ribosomal protein L25/general stress protein Ctc [Prevotella sp.]|jgi:large subunit ribosomal protein L25|nr:50S ribosomal protein L25/general stress protein Ctc [Prevotella sp.]MCH3986154.1 50S ribosomal protein L25/general stress protein Ctc [Prevotella sp.]MCI1686211.1 50S ribosomal protein L25/general stress protein Ctc [Prevotella sp.]MCI1817181.1 50S ribosomal protein L25/general stress protein Ctc [Prevotella sp.]MCI1848300.1 50S ribosomal protein L25/general stress protein Ctc [Prevotella sp.]MCI2138007.1 50S ribosomal protein L25/general stress protein Ctc [Prevotella sp.]
MKEITISGQKRTDLGKKASKELRKQGLVPCNIYGEAKENGQPVAMAFASPMSELRKIVYTPHIYVINITIDGQKHTAILKELQFQPVSDALLHVDFLEVNDQKPITIGIPVELKGLAPGVRDGGRMNLSIRKINVTAPYQNIPERLIVDVTKLELGKSIKVGQLHYDNIELATGKSVVVCSVKMTRQAVTDETAATAAGEEAAPAETAASTEAADTKDAKAKEPAKK